MVSPFLTKCCGHKCEQREPERDKHTHVAQTVVSIQLVHQEDLNRQMLHIKPRLLHGTVNLRLCPFSKRGTCVLKCRSVDVFKAKTHLKGKEGHDDSHPANRHGDVSSSLLCDDVNGAKKEDRPNYVVEDDEAQEGHQDPQWDTHYLQHTCRFFKLFK